MLISSLSFADSTNNGLFVSYLLIGNKGDNSGGNSKQDYSQHNVILLCLSTHMSAFLNYGLCDNIWLSSFQAAPEGLNLRV